MIEKDTERQGSIINRLTNYINPIIYFGIILLLCIFTFLYDAHGGSYDSYDSRDYLSPFFGRYFPWNYNVVPGYIKGLVKAVINFFFYGVLGFLVYRRSIKFGFKPLWNEEIKKIENFSKIFSCGMAMGVLFVLYNALTVKIIGISIFMYQAYFPSAIFKSIIMGIGEEFQLKTFGIVILVLFFIRIKKMEDKFNKDSFNDYFWTAAVICSLVYALKNIPGPYSTLREEISLVPMSIIIIKALPYASFSMVSAYFYKYYGLLSVIIIHVLTDFIWRVMWVIVAYGGLPVNLFKKVI